MNAPIIRLSFPPMHFRSGLGIGMLLATTVSSAAMLSDISDSPYRRAIEDLQQKGMIDGYADGTFKPNATINRAELIKILVGSEGEDDDIHHDGNCFSDVHEEWFASYVCAAKEHEWVSGYDDGSFRPEHTVLWSEAIKMIMNAGRHAPVQSPALPIEGMDPTAWYAPYVTAAINLNVIPQTYLARLGEPVMRGEIVDMLYRLRRQTERRSSSSASSGSRFSSIMSSIGNVVRRGGGGGGRAVTSSHSSAAVSSGASSSSTAPTSPTIIFNALSKGYGDADFTLAPTSDSDGVFTFTSSDEDVATVSGATVTLTGIGTTTITATQEANGAYLTGTASTVLTVGMGTPAIIFNDISKTSVSSPFSLAPTSNSDGAFSFESSNTNIATISGSTVTILAGGSVTITATQAASGNFNTGATTATLSIIGYDWCATFPCGLSGTCTRTSIIPGGALDDYSCTCDEGYAGHHCDQLAPELSSFGNISKQIGDIPFTLTEPTSNSNGAFTYVSSNVSVATISGSTVTLIASGSTTITATQAADGGYASESITLTLTVAGGYCTISNLCQNDATCINEPGGSYSCECADGWTGQFCHIDATVCDINPCLNGGSCVPTEFGASCACEECWMGDSCEMFDAGACA